MTASTLRYLVMAATFTYKINTDVEVLVEKSVFTKAYSLPLNASTSLLGERSQLWKMTTLSDMALYL